MKKESRLASRHVLVTNDFPPKSGGIQSYLWELWRRLPADSFSVVTSDWPGASVFDADQPFEILRLPRNRLLFPDPSLARFLRGVAGSQRADFVVFDPAFPTAWMGPALGLPYGVVVHGAEINVPAHLPVARSMLGRAIKGASFVIASSAWALERADAAVPGPMPRGHVIYPGVDEARFRPIGPEESRNTRASFGLPETATLILSVSRLVPRKGMDVLVKAVGRLHREYPDVMLAIGGQGRDRGRIERLAARERTPLAMLGAIPPERLAPLFGAADVFAMLCRDRWGGLEQEGFGIVFLEAAACGVPQVAGRSGGSAEAVQDGVSGYLLQDPTDVAGVAGALARLVEDGERRREMGDRARSRVLEEFGHGLLSERLAAVLDAH